MKRIGKKIIIGVAVMAAGTGLFAIWIRSCSSPRLRETPTVVRPKASLPQPVRLQPEFGFLRGTFRAGAGFAEAEATVDGGRPIEHVIRHEHAALAKESVELLLCSPELVELIEYLLKQPGMGGIDIAMNDQVAQLFRSERAAEARRSLLSLPNTLSRPDFHYRQKWSFDAGQGCPEEEFESFCAALDDPICDQCARHGRNVTLVKTDPKAAIASTVELLEAGRHPPHDIFFRLLKGFPVPLPTGTSFEELEGLLPLDRQDTLDYANRARHGLFRKWAAADPTAAANYVLANPDRISPKIMGTVVEVVVRDHPAAGVDWIQNLPDGPYFDAAARVAVVHIADAAPKTAGELAALITDPAIRKESLDIIEAKLRRRERVR